MDTPNLSTSPHDEERDLQQRLLQIQVDKQKADIEKLKSSSIDEVNKLKDELTKLKDATIAGWQAEKISLVKSFTADTEKMKDDLKSRTFWFTGIIVAIVVGVLYLSFLTSQKELQAKSQDVNKDVIFLQNNIISANKTVNDSKSEIEKVLNSLTASRKSLDSTKEIYEKRLRDLTQAQQKTK